MNGFDKWNVAKHTESFGEIFRKEEIIYLMSNSPNVLDIFESNKIYIIGGMVDHNRLKVFNYSLPIYFFF